MRKLLLFALLLFPFTARAQRVNSNPVGANLSVQDAGTCSTNGSFIQQVLPTNAGTTTVNLAGTFSATLLVRESNNGGGTWTTAATLTTAATSTYSTNGFTDLCVDLTAYTSGTVNVSVSTGLSQVQSVVSGGSSSSGAVSGSGVFNIGTAACGTAANCLQWVDDDSTNNCGTATTNFMTLVNAYAGPGLVQVNIGGSGPGKAYLLSSCNLMFVNAVVNCNATLDAGTNSGANLIQLGNGTNGLVKWNGCTFTGGASLTTAGIEVMNGVTDAEIANANWFPQFGAGNATLGNCTNFAIKFDNTVAEGTVRNNFYASVDSTVGRCFGFNAATSAGTGTIYWLNNVIGGKSGTICASQAIVEGGWYGTIANNNIGNVGVPIRLQGQGHRVDGNQLDTEGCTAHGVNAGIHFGAASSSTDVGGMTITNNVGQFGAGHMTSMLAQAGDSTATISSAILTGNTQSTTGSSPASLSATAALVNGTPNCTPGPGQFGYCFQYANSNLIPQFPCGATSTGWAIGQRVAACSSFTAGADIGSTALFQSPAAPATGAPVFVTCSVQVSTQATTSSTLPQCVITYTDGFTSASDTITVTPVLGATATVGCNGTAVANPPVGTSCQGSIGPLFVKLGTTMNYKTTGYASVGGTAMIALAFVTVDLH